MTDQTFESTLAAQLRTYAEQGVRPVDQYDVAEATIATGRPSKDRLLRLEFASRGWVAVVVALLLLALVASALIVGVRPPAPDRSHHLLVVSGDPITLATGGRAPDSTCLALQELDIDHGSTQRTAQCADHLVVSADGARSAERTPNGVTVTDLGAGSRSILADTSGAYPLAWSPGGRWLAWANCAPGAGLCDGVIGDRDGNSRNRFPIVSEVSASFGWSSDDSRLVVRDGSRVFVGDGNGSNLQAVGDDHPWIVLSPDGTEIAYAAGTNPFPGGAARAVDIYVSAPDGSGPRNVTQFDSETAYAVAWSPDGRTLVVISSSPRLAGSTSVEPAQVWVVDRAGGKVLVDVPTPILGGQARDWTTGIRWSPGGSWFAFESAPSSTPGPIDIVLVPFPGAGTVVLHDARLPTWSSDSRYLAVIVGTSAGSTIAILNANGSGQHTVAAAPNGLASQLLWAR